MCLIGGLRKLEIQLCRLGVSHKLAKRLDSFLTELSKSVCCILVTGSLASGEWTVRSDIDIVLIAEKEVDRHEVENKLIASRWPTKGYRPIVDVRVISKEALIKGLDDNEHFRVWMEFKMGMPIYGDNLSCQLKLQPGQIKRIAGRLIEDLNESFSWLESGVRFSGAALKIVNALKTFYYIERHVLQGGTHSKSKESLLRELLGESYKVTISCYYKITTMYSGKKRFQLPTKIDKEYSKYEYELLLSRSTIINEYVNHVYSQIGIL
jgi:predicted nucleotidyltransferase